MGFQERLFALLREKRVPFIIEHRNMLLAMADQPISAGGQPEPPFVSVSLAFVDRQLTMLVIRDDDRVDLLRLQAGLRRPDVTLVATSTLNTAFPDVELSSIPPLGHLWGLPTYVEAGLAQEQAIRFYAGSQQYIVTLRRSDFDSLTDPTYFEFSAREVAESAISA